MWVMTRSDGSWIENGRPWAAAGWGVCVHNLAELGEFYGLRRAGAKPVIARS